MCVISVHSDSVPGISNSRIVGWGGGFPKVFKQVPVFISLNLWLLLNFDYLVVSKLMV